MEQYFAVEDRNRRLHRTVCMFGGQPVYVQCSDPAGQTVNQDDEVFILFIGKGANVYAKVKYTDPLFQAASFPLGYMTGPHGVYYLTRQPAQQQKQGLALDSVEIISSNPMPSNWGLSKEFAYCILGKHPSFEEAVAQTLLKEKGCSFDRLFAVTPHFKKTLSLQYRGRAAGLVVDNKIQMFPSKEMRLLRSILSEKGLTTDVFYSYDSAASQPA